MAASDDMTKIRGKVSMVLSKFPQTRDSDKLLWLGFMAMFHDLPRQVNTPSMSDPYTTFKTILMDENTPTFESITRVRRKLQAEGKFLGTNQEEKQAEADRVREVMR